MSEIYQLSEGTGIVSLAATAVQRLGKSVARVCIGHGSEPVCRHEVKEFSWEAT